MEKDAFKCVDDAVGSCQKATAWEKTLKVKEGRLDDTFGGNDFEEEGVMDQEERAMRRAWRREAVLSRLLVQVFFPQSLAILPQG